MPIQTEDHAEVLLVRPSGRIDHASAASFEAELAPLITQVGARRGLLVLDFADVDYISSVGLRVLMVASRQIREQQAQFVLAQMQPLVSEIIAISRFDKVLTLAGTLDEAFAGCSPAAQASWAASGMRRAVP